MLTIASRRIEDVLRVGDFPVVGFTANATISRGGTLVMGRGAAHAVLQTVGGAVDRNFAMSIRALTQQDRNAIGVMPDYWIAPLRMFNLGRPFWLVAVQVKRHFRDQTETKTKRECVPLTLASLEQFVEFLIEHGGPTPKVAMNFPLVGNGGFTRDEIYPLIRPILDRPGLEVTLLTT